MSLAEIGLVASLAATGLWSGLLLTLVTILHPMFARLDGPAFAVETQRFLSVARRSPTNYGLVLAMVVAPVVALVALSARPGSATFLLVAGGLACTVAGPLLVSRFIVEPNYAVILAWDPEAMPQGWERVRARYFRLNWVRACITWTAFALFAAATLVELGA